MIRSGENIAPEAALKLLANYDIGPVAFSKLSVKLKESFSKVSFTELAPHFNLPTVDGP